MWIPQSFAEDTRSKDVLPTLTVGQYQCCQVYDRKKVY